MDDKYLNVLLIEDNVYDVRFLRRSLLREPLVELEQVDTISGALKKLEKGGIDVILLDLSLHDSQGVETFDRLYEHVSNLPIVVLTGYNDEDLAMKTLRHGAQDYLVKGMVESASLVRSIRYAIERKHAEMQHKTSQKHLNALASNLEKVKKQEDQLQHFDQFILPQLISLEGHLSALNKKLSELRPKDPGTVNQLDTVTNELQTALQSLGKFLKT
jgi:DNA-binding NarL/FixJ family response regulator